MADIDRLLETAARSAGLEEHLPFIRSLLRYAIQSQVALGMSTTSASSASYGPRPGDDDLVSPNQPSDADMNAQEFVACWKQERDRLLAAYLDEADDSEVATKIAALNLADDKRSVMRDVVGGILTDAFYTLLLGLDGAASIGDVQQMYEIRDEDGHRVADSGELEEEAWKQFQADKA